ncbi:MAG: alpha-amylase family glycosyl hydrolase [Verrucomicrobiota bacterium]|nr:alpha-amylase family glycosyl hydrolase [Verrucomicrobiota bacterium]
MWEGSFPKGLVFLEKDWEEDRLPMDLVEEAGLLGADFVQLSPVQRAKLGGYCKMDQRIVFVVEPSRLHSPNPSREKIFLAGDFNGWEAAIREDRWQLTFENEVFLLSLDWGEFSNLGNFQFKFITESRVWIEPTHGFPFVEKSPIGVYNFLFDDKRTGNDVFSFRIANPQDIQSTQVWSEFRPKGKFGHVRKDEKDSFRLFAPRAERVDLLLYGDSQKQEEEKRVAMHRDEEGSWTYEGLVREKYYRFSVFHKTMDKESGTLEKKILDPYAKATVGRNGPGLIITPQTLETRKSHWTPPPMKDLVILEAHVRDLLAQAPVDLSAEERLGFRGLTKWLQSESCYVRQLGVNAVELQPILEFDARTKSEYHWGYMPVNFFSPASSYSSCPRSGSVIREFQELVAAFHDAGIAVILDVVYNHVGIPAHLLNLDRSLYFRTDEFGRLQNHSGCGNDLRCEAEPVRKLILDSLAYLVQTFDVDGFRFDLGELMELDLLSEIETELKSIKPEICLIAEPWSFRGRLPPQIKNTSYALWSDRCREKILACVKGQGSRNHALALLQGKLDEENRFPWQSVNYLESHDDYTLVDRLLETDEESEFRITEETVKQVRLAMALVLFSPGIPMISAGQDLMRNKKGTRNTYLRGDLNEIDYSKSEEFADLRSDLKALIEFRLSEDALFLRPESHEQWRYEEIPMESQTTLGQRIFDSSDMRSYILYFNLSDHEIDLRIPEGYEILLSSKTENLDPFGYALAELKNS